MNINGLKLRYINGQCYEFILPNGKHLITDPYITPENLSGFRRFAVEEIEQCDYILLTHTHYDHTSDVGYLCRKFNAKLFAGQMSIMKLAAFYDLDLCLLYPVEHMEIFEMPDFTLQAIRGKHFGKPGKLSISHSLNLTQKKFGLEGYGELDVLGCVETYDFCLTL